MTLKGYTPQPSPLYDILCLYVCTYGHVYICVYIGKMEGVYPTSRTMLNPDYYCCFTGCFTEIAVTEFIEFHCKVN